MPFAHRGQALGSQIRLGNDASVSRATPCAAASSLAAWPYTASVAIATGWAPHCFSATSVPRTAEPALMTSLTIATRLSRSSEPYECPLDEGPTHCRNLMPPQTVRQHFRQGLHALRVQKKKLQGEPDLTVMPRLKNEMTFPLRKELRDLRLHLPAFNAQAERPASSPSALACGSAASW